MLVLQVQYCTVLGDNNVDWKKNQKMYWFVSVCDEINIAGYMRILLMEDNFIIAEKLNIIL